MVIPGNKDVIARSFLQNDRAITNTEFYIYLFYIFFYFIF